MSKGHSDVDVVIDEISMEGKFIHLVNKGKKDFNIGAWSITVEAGGVKESYRLPSNVVLMPGKTLTIWSSNTTEGRHNPPESIVMKNVILPVGEKIKAELYDENKKCAWLSSYYEIEHHQKTVYVDAPPVYTPQAVPLIPVRTERKIVESGKTHSEEMVLGKARDFYVADVNNKF